MRLSDELQKLADVPGNDPLICSRIHFREWAEKVRNLEWRLLSIQGVLEEAVCTVGQDKGVVMLSSDGPTHSETINGREVQVYDHEYFSPLGDALIEAWQLSIDKA